MGTPVSIAPVTAPVPMVVEARVVQEAVVEAAPPPPETVSVQMSADDYVDEVYYNGQSIRHTVSGVGDGVATLKTFTFQAVPGAVLAIAAHDNQPGNSASFYMKCTSTNPQSGWNMQIRPGHPSCKAFGTGGVSGGAPSAHQNVGSMGRPTRYNPPWGWETNGFDDSRWKAPTNQTHPSLVCAPSDVAGCLARPAQVHVLPHPPGAGSRVCGRRRGPSLPAHGSWRRVDRGWRLSAGENSGDRTRGRVLGWRRGARTRRPGDSTGRGCDGRRLLRHVALSALELAFCSNVGAPQGKMVGSSCAP